MQRTAAGADRRTVVVIAAAVLAVTVVAGVVAVAALAGPRAAGSDVVTAAPPSAAPGAPGASARSTSPTAPASTSAPDSSAGGLVQMDPAAVTRVPVETQQVVLDLLDRHFAAINTGDYSMWAGTVVPRRAQDQPVGTWTDAYATTYDEAVTVMSLDPTGPDSVLVGLSFVSNQSATDAPADLPVTRICWQTRWPVVGVSTGAQLGTPPSGTTTRRAC